MEVLNNFSCRIAGASGQGIMSTGSLLAKTACRSGLYACTNAEYPSLIKGGHSHLDVRLSDRPVAAVSRHINLLIALDQKALVEHTAALTPGGGVILDSDTLKSPEQDNFNVYPIPLTRLARQSGSPIMRNVVAIGALCALTDFGLEKLHKSLEKTFSKKGEQIIKHNKIAAQLGFDFARENFRAFRYKLQAQESKDQIFISGNEALALGAIQAGCKFYSAYPMTPATSVLHTMAKFENEFNLVVKHTEDEIAAVNMAVGAAFTGVRAMTGTSGGGFCLMTEGLGLASATEIPIVIVESQRPGPGSGLATRSGQGDLRFMLHASTDEAPRIIIAPGDVDECFYLTHQAFNLAEKYQVPAIILVDKNISVNSWTTKPFDTSMLSIDRGELLTEKVPENYLRYKKTPSGVSPRAIPGVPGGEHVASSYEHDEEGTECEDPQNKIEMHRKRFKKFELLAKEIQEPKLIGPQNSDITIISWGSTKGAVTEARTLLAADGIKTSHLHLAFLSPLPIEAITKVMENSRRTVIVENNMTSQLAGWIKENNGMEIDHKILKFDGRGFFPEDISMGIRFILNPEEIKFNGERVRVASNQGPSHES